MVALEGVLLLTSETLSHFEYHWFWGLIFNPSIVREGNMAVQAEQLAQNEPLLRSLQEQQWAVSKRSVIIQFIYRFFNINDFAFNTYRLAAYESNKEFMQLAQGKENMPNYWKTKKKAAVQEKQAGKSWQWARNAMYKKLQAYRSRPNYLNEAREEIELVVVEISQNQPTDLPVASIGKRIMVKASMQPHLRQLGINRSEGDSLDWSDIRHAFFAKARLAHPDKNGSAEWFRNIKNALDRLEQQIFCEQGENQQKNHNEWQDFFYEAYKEFDRTMTRVEAGIAKLNTRIAELNTGIAETNTRIAALDTGIAETNTRIAELNTGIAALDTGIAETNKGIAALNETYDELENNLNKRILRKRELEKLLLEYARENGISLSEELLPPSSSQSQVFSNQYCPGFFGSQPADQSQAELSLGEDSRAHDPLGNKEKSCSRLH